MKITIGTRSGDFPVPTTVLAAVRELVPEMADETLACLWEGTVLELNTYLHAPCDLLPITYKDDEGRRIYERSLRFVLLIAAMRLYPDDKLRIEHSLGQGVYIEMDGRRLYAADVHALEGMMRDIIHDDLPFERSQWSREQAIAYFRERGDEDKARLLGYRPYDFFNIYTCGGLSEYFYGAMLPSTGMLKVFSLHAFAPGLLMQLPDREDPSRAAEVARLPKHVAVFAQSNYWCRVLDCSTAADLNGLIANDRLRDFIRVNEAFHSKSLAEIAEDITRRHARAIFISGPSSSGKTTFANRLSIQLRVSGLQPVIISMDDFYRNRDDLPLEPDGQPDLEALTALDVDLLNQSIESLLLGAETPMPRFNFAAKRREEKRVMMRIGPNTPLIIEGIHGLNPALHQHFDRGLLCRIYISQLTALNLDRHNRIRTTDARLLRRIVRDYQFRSTPPIRTLEMWDSVRRGEERWIFPYQEQADIVFNSALHYELPILKTMSFGILSQVPQDSPEFVKCNRILKILNYILPAPEAVFNEIPPTSILREFIGGNTLYMDE
ncbi:MAG TPA: nucleoside kinase [Candidatus Limnocylindria bacterium]|nr:nucleoside kinase [Candidatus Limnocylindria bacterium]